MDRQIVDLNFLTWPLSSMEITAFEYVPFMDIQRIDPVPGRTASIYVDSRFISWTHPPIADRVIYGNSHYSPDSDIAAMVFHSGILYIDLKSKESTRRQFCTVQNVFELMACSETEYQNRAVVNELPQDLRIQGVLVLVMFCRSPPVFPSVNKNGLRSKEAEKDTFSMRIANFKIITRFDEKPTLVAPEDVPMRTFSLPRYSRNSTGELAMIYTPDLFLQVFSLANIINKLMDVYRIFFDAGSQRYEIVLTGESEPYFDVLEYLEPVTIEALKKRPNDAYQTQKCVQHVHISSVTAREKSLNFNGVTFSGVTTLTLVCISGKLSKFPNLRGVLEERK